MTIINDYDHKYVQLLVVAWLYITFGTSVTIYEKIYIFIWELGNVYCVGCGSCGQRILHH